MSVSAALPVTYGVPSLLSIWPRRVRIVSTAAEPAKPRRFTVELTLDVGLLRLGRQGHARMRNDNYITENLNDIWSRG
jgi:hypothetical protein